MANGMAIGNNQLYVADTLDKSISIFEIEKDELKRKRIIKLNHLPDNIKYDEASSTFFVASLSTGWDMTYYWRQPNTDYQIPGQISVIS